MPITIEEVTGEVVTPPSEPRSEPRPSANPRELQERILALLLREQRRLERLSDR